MPVKRVERGDSQEEPLLQRCAPFEPCLTADGTAEADRPDQDMPSYLRTRKDSTENMMQRGR
jgi:hypothetical protein